MNTECVYRPTEQTIEGCKRFAERINNLDCELYPVSIAKVTQKVSGLKKGDLIVFVGGKYHYMTEREDAKMIDPCNLPYTPDWYKDFIEF